MIDRRFEVIEKDENQELSKILACAEQHLTCVEFGRKLLYMRLRAAQTRASSSQERKSTTVCSRSTTP